MFRDSAQAFAYDSLALGLAQEAIAVGADKALQGAPLSFLYMPFMHSESRKIHEIAVELYSAPGLEENLGYEVRHKVIIDRFGRYPHRNAQLGRVSTPEEEEFLRQPGSRFSVGLHHKILLVRLASGFRWVISGAPADAI